MYWWSKPDQVPAWLVAVLVSCAVWVSTVVTLEWRTGESPNYTGSSLAYTWSA
jgi:hypothetical protein